MPTDSTPTATSEEGDTTFTADAALARQVRFLKANLSSIPDFVYAFDRQRRFAYANPPMLALFGLSADEMLGKTFADLDYPPDVADLLNSHIDRIFQQGINIEDEVFFRSPTGQAAYFAYLWGPVRGEDGSVERVVGVSRDISERRAFEEALRESEARLRAATELVGLGIYSWNPLTDTLQWDERMRAMWGLPPDANIEWSVFEAGIHPADLARVKRAISACLDRAGDGHYNIEYRVLGRDDGVMRHIATSGRTTFEQGRAVGCIGAAIDVTAQRSAEAAIRASEAQFRSFAAHSSNLIWIGDPVAGTIIYRSAAYELIWGIPCAEAANNLTDWMKDVHPDDRQQVERALSSVKAGDVTKFEYRIIRPADGTVRWLRDTSFPIRGDDGAIIRIGGITEDLTQEGVRHAYIVTAEAAEGRRLANIVRGLGYSARTFESASAFLDIAVVLASGCALVDLRKKPEEGLSILRELKARSIQLPTIAVDGPRADAATAVAAMKAGAVDHVIQNDYASFRKKLESALAECQGAMRPATRDENAGARVARLTPREREVLIGLVDGGTNKVIGQKLGISARTVELHRAQVMNRLDASSLTELLQIALAAGITPSAGVGRNQRKDT
jgi:PAS domain S-box-containing protein